MFKKLIEYFRIGLALAKADPADREEIRRLQREVGILTDALSEARAAAPTSEEAAELNSLLAEFAATTEPPAADKPTPGIRIATDVYTAREFYSGEQGVPLRCIDGSREKDVTTLAEAEAFFNAGSIPPVLSGDDANADAPTATVTPEEPQPTTEEAVEETK